MNTTNIQKRSLTAALGAAVATVAAPALLFLGSGTAHAGGQFVGYDRDSSGVTITMSPQGSTYGDCTFTVRPYLGGGYDTPPGPPAEQWTRQFHMDEWAHTSLRLPPDLPSWSDPAWYFIVECSSGGSFRHLASSGLHIPMF